MRCLSIGALQMLLEDLGFSERQDIPPISMTYHCHDMITMTACFSRIYADLNVHNTIELLVEDRSLLMDRWRLDADIGLYFVVDDRDFNLYDPNSIELITDYIVQEIESLGD